MDELPKNTASAIGVISLRTVVWTDGGGSWIVEELVSSDVVETDEGGCWVVEELASPDEGTTASPLWNGATGA